MKKLLLPLLLTLSLNTFALSFKAGAEVGDIHPRLLNSLIQRGADNHNGFKIVYAAGAEIPAPIKKKWDERKLTGEAIPEPGTAGPKVIFIESF